MRGGRRGGEREGAKRRGRVERKEGEIEKLQSRDSSLGVTPLTVHILSALPHCPSGSSVSVCIDSE